MKERQWEYKDERNILIGLIVDKQVLGRVADLWQPNLFRSPWANRVAQWCVQYYRKYQKAPGPHIRSLYDHWAQSSPDSASVTILGEFLDGLSQQYTHLRRNSNSEYLLDRCGTYFREVQLEHLTETVQGHLIEGQVEPAYQAVRNFTPVEVGVGQVINVMQDKDAIRTAFEQMHKPVIEYQGGLKRFFGDRLERDGFIAAMGPEKRGKSFWLLDMAFQAVLQHRMVAFFECGDLSQHQIMRRFMARFARHPVKAGDIEYPTLIKKEPKKPPVVIHQIRHFDHGLSWAQAYHSCQQFIQRHCPQAKPLLRLSCHYNDTLTIDGLRSILDSWAREEWIPDVIVIDYADILNMEGHGLEGRDRIDRTWRQMRRLSQERHCLVLTATQSDSASYKAVRLGKQHFSDDKRKHAHVTGMFGLNQTETEKEKGIMRLNWLDLREAFFSERHCCYVATCLPIAHMSVQSCYEKI